MMFELQEDQLVGAPLWLQIVIVVAGAIVHDDITCIMVGVYASSGAVLFWPLTLAALAGTYLGDLGWFVLGRWAGRLAANWRFFDRWAGDPRLVQARRLLVRYGSYVIIASRFLPGLRTPVQLAAGALYTDLRKACLYFLFAACLYAPLLVGGTALLGEQIDAAGLYQRYGHLALLVTALLVLLAIWLIRAMTTSLLPTPRLQQAAAGIEKESEAGTASDSPD